LINVTRPVDNHFVAKLRICTIAVITVLVSAHPTANSQCIVMTTAQAKDFAEVVLLGRVVAVEREKFRSILTVEVQRVWKGIVPKRISLIQSFEGVRPLSLITTFIVDETYVIFAGQAFRPAKFTEYVDDCTSKPATAFNLSELGDSTPPEQ
jgi:hypothetical protein